MNIIKNNERNLTKVSMILLILAAIFSFGINSVSADSSIIYVNDSSGNDDWDGQYAEWIVDTLSGPKKSIKNATGTVTQGGTVNIADGNYIGENNTNITINKNMNIIGQSTEGTIINGTDIAQIFLIQNGINVKIQNLTICNGTAVERGAISNSGNLTVNGVIFTGNYAIFYGGAIYNIGYLTVTNSIFTNNRVTNPEGGGTTVDGFSILFPSGGAILNLGNLFLSNSTFNNNTSHFAGGAIYNGGNLIEINCTFSNNTSTLAGAIFSNGGTSTAPVTISGSTFTDNLSTSYQGAAICGYGGNLIITGCNFTHNTNFNGDGGAIYNQIGKMTIINSDFIENTVNNDGNGGAIFNRQGDLTITGCNFTNNTARSGGAIYNEANSIGYLTVNSCNFTDNAASDIFEYGGGAIYSVDKLNVSNSSFNNNTGNLVGPFIVKEIQL